MSKVRAKPLSRREIRDAADSLRAVYSINTDNPVLMPILLERMAILPFEGKLLDYQILPDDDSRLFKGEEAKTDIVDGKIYIKESVYAQACGENPGRASFTIAHEIGHFYLHFIKRPTLSRTTCKYVRAYEDAEWQADAFASELLMPYEGCLYLTSSEIKDKYKVSREAAEVRHKLINR